LRSTVGAARHLGWHQKNPVAKTPAANIGLRVDQLALNIMALRLGVGVAGMLCAMRRDLILYDAVSQCRCLADRGGAGDDGQKAAPIDLRRRRFRWFGSRPPSLFASALTRVLLFIALALFLQVLQELIIVLLRHLRLAPAKKFLSAERFIRQAMRLALEVYLEIWTLFFLFCDLSCCRLLGHG
jgi:hypothetical protein